jgi:acetyl-CoA acyltransferase 2
MMGPDRRKVYIVKGRRTPFCKFGRSLAAIPLVALAAAAKALIQEGGVNPGSLDQVIFANLIPSTPDTLYGARHLGLQLGLRVEAPAHLVNRLCGPGIQPVLDDVA